MKPPITSVKMIYCQSSGIFLSFFIENSTRNWYFPGTTHQCRLCFALFACWHAGTKFPWSCLKAFLFVNQVASVLRWIQSTSVASHCVFWSITQHHLYVNTAVGSPKLRVTNNKRFHTDTSGFDDCNFNKGRWVNNWNYNKGIFQTSNFVITSVIYVNFLPRAPTYFELSQFSLYKSSYISVKVKVILAEPATDFKLRYYFVIHNAL